MNNNLPEDLSNIVSPNTSDLPLNSSHLSPNTAHNNATSDRDTQDDYTLSDSDDVTFELTALENIIKQRLSIIEKTQLEVSELRTQLNDMMANSEEYYKADKASKEATKLKKQVKSTIMGSEEAKMLQGKYDESKEDLKENQLALSELLLDFYEKMHVKEIDDLEGKQRDLVIKVSVAPSKKI